MLGGLIAGFVILGLFLSMLTSAPRTNVREQETSSTDTPV